MQAQASQGTDLTRDPPASSDYVALELLSPRTLALFGSGRIFVDVEHNDSLSLARPSPNNYVYSLRKRLRNLRSYFPGVGAAIANVK
jgi:hypothetical protein